MSSILRYDGEMHVYTSLNPIEDLMSWISGLKSHYYTSDILKTIHGFTNTKEIRKCAQLISTYAENASGLIQQAYLGPADMSFLPLYYAILNLSKIYVVLSGNSASLQANRYHGATYKPLERRRHDLLLEKITLKKDGMFSIFYNTLTGLKINLKDKQITLREIYPYIVGISHEFKHAYKCLSSFQFIDLYMTGTQAEGYQINIKLLGREHNNQQAKSKRYLKILKGFYANRSDQKSFSSKKLFDQNDNNARKALLKDFRRYLLYYPERDSYGVLRPATPLSMKRFLLPEEIPIWLAFFHLSNIVRYNPEFLAIIKDSKAWPMLLALRKHAMMRFMLLFWSYLHKTTYTVSIR